ncbi:hypothetical protein F5Y05DRAFT_408356 [Hypoxylon sp. FL0543]|nr:hypothetical protein F5Y05DRAFT_408356 [Hypoxylon sp. FL0543]
MSYSPPAILALIITARVLIPYHSVQLAKACRENGGWRLELVGAVSCFTGLYLPLRVLTGSEGVSLAGPKTPKSTPKTAVRGLIAAGNLPNWYLGMNATDLTRTEFRKKRPSVGLQARPARPGTAKVPRTFKIPEDDHLIPMAEDLENWGNGCENCPSRN